MRPLFWRGLLLHLPGENEIIVVCEYKVLFFWSIWMESNLKKGYLEAYEIACGELGKKDPGQISLDTDAHYDVEVRSLKVRFLNIVHSVSFPGGEVAREDGAEVPDAVKALILHYLLNAKKTQPAGKLISFREVRGGGMNYYTVFCKRAIFPLQKAFEGETEKLAAIGKMTAQVVHEINNPLAGIKNSLLLVKEAANKNHKYYEYIERIEKEIDRVSNILKQMFDLYRPDISAAKEFHLYNTIFDVSELLKDAVNQKNIEIEIECSRKISINISEDLLRQVIFNLIRNAINASGHNSKIKVNATLADGFLKLSVTDNGPGIDDKIKDKIFDPFFTTGIGGSDSGLGLGLAITKDIITAMRGQINFENINPKGAKFYISIPLNNGSLLK
jgi:signal transduction histidine kinase